MSVTEMNGTRIHKMMGRRRGCKPVASGVRCSDSHTRERTGMRQAVPSVEQRVLARPKKMDWKNIRHDPGRLRRRSSEGVLRPDRMYDLPVGLFAKHGALALPRRGPRPPPLRWGLATRSTRRTAHLPHVRPSWRPGFILDELQLVKSIFDKLQLVLTSCSLILASWQKYVCIGT
jgi:hypothetical protein